MVRAIYVEKKEAFAGKARELVHEFREVLMIDRIENVRVINRYFVEDLSDAAFQKAKECIFSEPPTDLCYEDMDLRRQIVVAVEYLPGQFDQRAHSAEECLRFIAHDETPTVQSSTLYILEGDITNEDLEKIKGYLINPVEAREASLSVPVTLKARYPEPEPVAILEGFTKYNENDLQQFHDMHGLAMDLADLRMCRDYFAAEERDPSIAEIRVIDTYWSDHCRHTTFNTTIDKVLFRDPVINETFSDYLDLRESLGVTKPISLMNVATIAVKALKADGRLTGVVESEEINACTVDFKCEIDGEEQDWVLLFKNETHNHPTEIEPFGGAATCIGGAIRDPLSGRSYVYAAMRVTGAGNPLTPASETREGKLPQRKIVTTAAAGYSSYGNQIGLTTGLVDEIYHEGYVAKRMEVGAVIGAAPAENIRRERPEPGDKIILLGGRTGRDGIGGATGSSKSHSVSSLESCGAEVQKGNAPEERKLQRLFRDPRATRLIKRCNDFGAGGVSVAIGELADGLEVTLDNVPKKYDGLDGTELAISESQERMAVVVAAEDVEAFKLLAEGENLEATVVAEVTEKANLTMYFKGQKIVDIKREFLDTNGAEKHATAKIEAAQSYTKPVPAKFYEGMKDLAADLNVCSKRGLSERFDSTIGANTVLMPFGGVYQRTPIQTMVHKIPMLEGDTGTVSLMAYGFNPYISERSPYHGAYLAIVESICKLLAAGAKFENVYLSLQEYFERLGTNDAAWGKALAAVLGAYRAQMELGVGAIGGKDSMSGTFEDIHVPPTLISFAVTTDRLERIVSPEFKRRGHSVIWLRPEYGRDGLPTAESLLRNFRSLQLLFDNDLVASCWTPGYGGPAEAVYKMAIGNGVGFEFAKEVSNREIFSYAYGSFIIELEQEIELGAGMTELGRTIAREAIVSAGGHIRLAEMDRIYETRLEPVYPFFANAYREQPAEVSYRSRDFSAVREHVYGRPRFLVPVFPGTNCEYDSARAIEFAGGEAEVFIINNLTTDKLKESVENFAEAIRCSQAIFIPGGFSGADEPDGSGKFITSFFRNEAIAEEVRRLLDDRDGLIAGICNGFQALIKLGLLPYGEIAPQTAYSPTLTFNDIGRHQSKLVRTRICSTKSPWLRKVAVGEILTVPISHGEGKFVATEDDLDDLLSNGQILTQYVDLAGNPTMDIRYNPNGSMMAVEGILSPDGRILGKMGHSERIGNGLYKNVPGSYDLHLFESAVDYFTK
ncbi:MAG: phosphoribosylformylglycinamidine synthase [Mogibacterium sp.]|nr:phosphoribosylformylglycinamidine synthase [Mogibacterium sp.]